ncbi:unnamed protein product [Adineta steineri]|uniref:Uncharacterized protein n=1 Tax=Adineta steineri TaxID=433720 RepID=A0A813Y3L8_9BILA|nr:unnamed protein product [Adineta steineri]CAF0880447.1 unnamed protein product [Adineta steineri]CAF0939877.1 unnamed protein product [Adineta steineri]CAF3599734.1 unnamed protein product [Adineta steineri]CAF3762484.1 unnamed protein product [Adineta steineri]
MLHSIITLTLCLSFLPIISSQNLNGIFLIDSCKCNSSAETCEPSGPFIFNQQRATVAIRYGSQQVGIGSLGKNQLDLYLNQNRCKGLWNGKTHSAELKCQHKGGIMCTTNLRCLSGLCLDETKIIISSSSIKRNISYLFMISILIMLV